MSEDDIKFNKCILCKKIYPHTHKWTLLGDGSMICEKCTMDIRDNFSYYIGGKRVSQEEYKSAIDKAKLA